MSDVSLSKKEYLELKDAQEKLRHLENGGIDNWEYYDLALENYKPTSELYEEAEAFLNELTENAEVDEPAGAGAGYQIVFDDVAIERVMKLMKTGSRDDR